MTPVQSTSRLSKLLEIDLRIKRDDLLPMAGGGNKVRKMRLFAAEAEKAGCDAIVTCGGAQSNHCRVAALMAAERGWRCRLVLHGAPEDQCEGNLLLMKLAGAELCFVEPDGISEAMRCSRESLESEGSRVYEIPGGGHSVVGALAYVDAAEELAQQCEELDWFPDWVVLASGTGTTQAGLIAGFERRGPDCRVVGISVARRNPRGSSVVEQSLDEVRRELGLAGSAPNVDLRDDWVGLGYEQAGEDVLSAIRFAAENGGLICDPTYTGKALLGMLGLIESGEIAKGSRVLFWHTGGLLNLMAAHCGLGGKS